MGRRDQYTGLKCQWTSVQRTVALVHYNDEMIGQIKKMATDRWYWRKSSLESWNGAFATQGDVIRALTKVVLFAE